MSDNFGDVDVMERDDLAASAGAADAAWVIGVLAGEPASWDGPWHDPEGGFVRSPRRRRIR